MEVERLQQVAEGRRVARRELVEQAQLAERGVLVARLAGQGREPQQAERGGRAARRDRRVLEVLAARDERLVVVGGREEAAALAVGEAREQRRRPSARASANQRSSNVAS